MTNRILQDPSQVLASCQFATGQLTRLISADNDDRLGPTAHSKAQQWISRLAAAARSGAIQVRLLPHFAAFAADFALLLLLSLGMRRIHRRMEQSQQTGVEGTDVYRSLSVVGDQMLAALDATEEGITSGFPAVPEMPKFSANLAVQALQYYSLRALPLFDESKLAQVKPERLETIDNELAGISAAAAGLCDAARLMADFIAKDNARVDKSGQPEEKTRQLRRELAATILALAGEEQPT